MRILHTVESYYPAGGGMAEVVKQLSERLVKMGHTVTVATKKDNKRRDYIINGVIIKDFEIGGNEVRGLTGEVDAYKKFLLDSDFDIVANFAAQQWATDIALPILDKIKGKKINIPTGFSGLYQDEYKAYFENMKTWMKSYDANLFQSDSYRDISFARSNGITKNFLIANGADEREFASEEVKIDIRKKFGLKPDCFLILHVGTFTGIKGHLEAIVIFLRSALKNSTLLMFGHNVDYIKKHSIYNNYTLGLLWLSKLFTSKRIILATPDRETIVEAYKQADLFLFPSCIECSPVVLYESMAAETPFLTTDVGNSKEIIEWSHGGMLLPTTIDKNGYSHAKIPESVTMLNELCNNRASLDKMGKNGRKTWEEKFTWDNIAKQYLNLYQKLLNTPS